MSFTNLKEGDRVTVCTKNIHDQIVRLDGVVGAVGQVTLAVRVPDNIPQRLHFDSRHGLNYDETYWLEAPF